MLTRKQLDLLEFIHKRVQRDGVPPSFDEMKEALDLRSKSGIHRLITALEERGFIRRLPHRARAIEIVKLPEALDRGAGGRAGFEEEDFDAVETFLRVNAVGPMRLTQRLLPNLRAGTGKTIAHLTSKMGSITDNTSGGAYGYRSSKSALNMLNKSMSIELRREGFTCVLLHPGWVATDMGGSAAPLKAPESIDGMLSVIDRLKPSDTGRFFDYSGAEIPW